MHWYQQGHNPRSTYIKKKKKISKNHRQIVPYIKPPVTMKLKVRTNFFGTKIRAFSEAKSGQNI